MRRFPARPASAAVRADIAVRAARPDVDADAIAAVIAAGRGGPFPVPTAAGLLAELAGRPARGVGAWLALAGDEPVGLLAAVTAVRDCRLRHSIGWLLVARHSRRRGVGTALVNAAVCDARARGAEEVWVETRADWREALAFWATQGFRAAE